MRATRGQYGGARRRAFPEPSASPEQGDPTC